MSERNPLPACLSHLGQMAPVPDGYVLVPVELPEMASSILETILRAASGFGVSPMNVRGIWRALITAAADETSPPAPPTPVAGMTEAQVGARFHPRTQTSLYCSRDCAAIATSEKKRRARGKP